MRSFAVTSNSFEIAKKFKKDIEQIGFTYVDGFSLFHQSIFEDCKGFYFSDVWRPSGITEIKVPFGFAISGIPRSIKQFHLDNEYEAALEYCKSIFVGVTTVTMKEIAEWKGCAVNLLKIVE